MEQATQHGQCNEVSSRMAKKANQISPGPMGCSQCGARLPNGASYLKHRSGEDAAGLTECERSQAQQRMASSRTFPTAQEVIEA